MRRVVRLGHQHRDVTADHLIGRVARNLYRGRVERLDGAPLVDDHHGVDCGFHDRPAPRFAFRQRQGGLDTRGFPLLDGCGHLVESMPQGRDLGGTDWHSRPGRTVSSLPSAGSCPPGSRPASGMETTSSPPRRQQGQGQHGPEQTEGTHHRPSRAGARAIFSFTPTATNKPGDGPSGTYPKTRSVPDGPASPAMPGASARMRLSNRSGSFWPTRAGVSGSRATMVPSRSATMTLASGRSGLRAR